MKLSEYFTLEEATYSETAIRLGINNQPDAKQLENMKTVANTHADLIRRELGHPVHINSWLRLPDVNVAVGGSKVSSHMDGFAFDMTCSGYGDTLKVAKAIAKIFSDHGVKFDQIIHEYGRWIHVSGAPEGRCQLLTIYRPENKYKTGLLSEAEYHAA